MMKLEVLVSAVGQDVSAQAAKMHLECDAVIVNQTNRVSYTEYEYHGYHNRCYEMTERGVGLSRNHALMYAQGDIVLFSDEDIVYDEGYAERILTEFEKHPEVDLLLFNMRVGAERATYHTEKYHRVHIWNAGRYPTYAVAARRERLIASRVAFSLLFGGGAEYSNGEDSLFLKDCLSYGLKIYATPVEIGEETVRESTWFHGYDEKFFIDRGVLYHFLYGRLAVLMAVRFLAAHGERMCGQISRKDALALMKQGIISVKGW